METDFMYYVIMIIFGAVGVLFFVYPFLEKRLTFNFKDIILYWAIGAFFSALAIAMLLKNGVVMEILLAALLGSLTLMAGVSWIKDVIVHHIKVEGILTDVQKVSGKHGSHYKLTFNVPEKKAKYTVEYASSARRFTIGETYKIHIRNKGNTAYIHRPLWFIFGVFTSLFGLVWLSLILELLNIKN